MTKATGPGDKGKATALAERLTFHDLRAESASVDATWAAFWLSC